jgi:F-type H+-transporting ATPase subunit b
MSLLSPELGLLFWMLLTFGIVFIILAKYGFPVIVKSIDQRKAVIAKGLEDARKSEEQLKVAQQTCNDLINEAQMKKDAILREAAELKERMIGEAREKSLAEGLRLTEQAKKDAAAEKDRALRSLHNEVAALSVQLSEQILRRELEESAEQKALIERFMIELDDKAL